MSIAEAALYGDLVKHLRDICAQQMAQLKGVSVESERAALDEAIRVWFFTPQEDLYGFTPQRVIRNEELGIANTIPGDRLGDLFEDDCPVCADMRAEAEASIEQVLLREPAASRATSRATLAQRQFPATPGR